jgi:hypothetical protein
MVRVLVLVMVMGRVLLVVRSIMQASRLVRLCVSQVSARLVSGDVNGKYLVFPTPMPTPTIPSSVTRQSEVPPVQCAVATVEYAVLNLSLTFTLSVTEESESEGESGDEGEAEGPFGEMRYASCA